MSKQQVERLREWLHLNTPMKSTKYADIRHLHYERAATSLLPVLVEVREALSDPGCSCGKQSDSGDPEHHSELCMYRRVRPALDRIEELIGKESNDHDPTNP